MIPYKALPQQLRICRVFSHILRKGSSELLRELFELFEDKKNKIAITVIIRHMLLDAHPSNLSSFEILINPMISCVINDRYNTLFSVSCSLVDHVCTIVLC